MLYIAWIGIRHTVKRVTLEEPDDILFTEMTSLVAWPGQRTTRPRRRR